MLDRKHTHNTGNGYEWENLLPITQDKFKDNVLFYVDSDASMIIIQTTRNRVSRTKEEGFDAALNC
jgi:hypothetical protein